jgi:acetyltransferase-like isoleucine patch superfamily enzyme
MREAWQKGLGLARWIKKVAKSVIFDVLRLTRIGRIVFETRDTQTPVTFRRWIMQKVLGFNRGAYWPVHFSSTVTNWRNVYAGVDVSPGYSPGCYIQAIREVYIGDYTQIAPNVGIISMNHDVHDSRNHSGKTGVHIGRYCWIGMNAVILPGVTLGDFTIVGAGSVVTKSQPEGYCVVAGNPASMIRRLDREKCVRFRNVNEYNGYISAERFESFRVKHLRVSSRWQGCGTQ